ncbi:hypothetical protein [Massilia sp. S19_KUP03_FR1]|uniref:hypothetical protein n=1 Tax=Massilia sp. S19_KUP03_FR1 TaxID=3025503 RepID=UPI002FCDBC71
MTIARHFFIAAVLAAGLAGQARADSFASSASSAGSASSGSISTSLNGSSNSSTGNDKIANGAWRIDRVEQLAQLPGRPEMVRLAMQAEQVDQQLTLDLPVAVFASQNLGQGDLVDVQKRDYGFQFARNDTRTAFFLVLADDWHDELAARPVTL